jgi:hypothetical protein
MWEKIGETPKIVDGAYQFDMVLAPTGVVLYSASPFTIFSLSYIALPIGAKGL